jgi:hypothetical protein
MRLTLVVPDQPGIDRRSFECSGCGHTELLQVKYW